MCNVIVGFFLIPILPYSHSLDVSPQYVLSLPVNFSMPCFDCGGLRQAMHELWSSCHRHVAMHGYTYKCVHVFIHCVPSACVVLLWRQLTALVFKACTTKPRTPPPPPPHTPSCRKALVVSLRTHHTSHFTKVRSFDSVVGLACRVCCVIVQCVCPGLHSSPNGRSLSVYEYCVTLFRTSKLYCHSFTVSPGYWGVAEGSWPMPV